MQERRLNKIARLIQKELAEMFLTETRQMPGVIVSVTNVRPTSDMSLCRIYLSIYPSERAEEMIELLRKNAVSVRYTLGTRLRSQLRTIPELQFFIDDSLDYLEHIDKLLGK